MALGLSHHPDRIPGAPPPGGHGGRRRDGELIDAIATAGDGRAIAGAFEETRGVQVTEDSNGALELLLVALEDELSILQRIEIDSLGAILPTLDDGIDHVDTTGVLRTFDATGTVVAELDTTVPEPITMARARTSDRLAVVNQDGGVVIDPERGIVAAFPADGLVGISFVNGDAQLVLSQADGTISPWDIEGGDESVIVDGSGSTGQGLPFYDEGSDSLWLVAQGDIVQLPMSSDRWIELACAAAGRDLTDEEWERFVPGGGTARSACTT